MKFPQERDYFIGVKLRNHHFTQARHKKAHSPAEPIETQRNMKKVSGFYRQMDFALSALLVSG